MKRYLLFLSLLLTCTAQAKYIPLTFTELVLKSDKIVQGEIICVDEHVVELKVQESIGHTSDTITISKFVDWACGKRWTDYEIGQTSVFFLNYRNNALKPLGGGNEGEMPIHDNMVYMHLSAISVFGVADDLKKSDRSMEDHGFNNPYNGYVVDLPLFWEATKTLATCFECNVGINGRLIDLHLNCDKTFFEETAEKNNLVKWANRQLEN